MIKVLVADDHLVTRKLLQTTLEKNGYSAVVAEDGKQAWDLLMNSHDIRLAILDWMMPEMDGVEICKRLQSAPSGALIYVILLTAREGTDNITEALKAGANDYITKPFKKEELLARLYVGERNIHLQNQLTQSQKLESIGQLAAGIAHEINTPAQYISDNFIFLHEAFTDVVRLLDGYNTFLDSTRSTTALADKVNLIDELLSEIDADFLKKEIPHAIQQSIDGIDHVAHIVRAMKDFAHPGTEEKQFIDINKAIENTSTISRSKWKYIAELEMELDENLPLVPCLPAEINQTVLNLIINAADAIAEVVDIDKNEKGLIKIKTHQSESWCDIFISDTGPGIPDHIQSKIFNPFFTTKEIGIGSGQGLSIAHSIIVDKHQGHISFETDTNGTTFIIRIPLVTDQLTVSI